MATTTFSTEVVIGVPPAEVGRFLVQFTNHLKVHPLIVAISAREPSGHEDTSEPSDNRQYYTVTDALGWGPFRVRITYKVCHRVVGPESLMSEAWQRPGVYLRNHTTWRATEHGSTYLREEVLVRAPFPLLWLTVRLARSAHSRSFLRLKSYLESQLPR